MVMSKIIFVILKIAEVCAVVFIPYYTGLLACYLGFSKNAVPYWFIGMLFLSILIVLAFIGSVLFFPFINLNMKMANAICKWTKEK